MPCSNRLDALTRYPPFWPANRTYVGRLACLLPIVQHSDVRRACLARRSCPVDLTHDRRSQIMRRNPMATEARETAGLIGSDKVDGTYVYDARGEHIGSIERVMIEKVRGQVAYAVLSFGGFLGIGSDYYPIPWESLTYDTSLGGYRTNLTEAQLTKAPKYSGTSWDWEDRARGRQVYDYYGAKWFEY